jgi:hypothetical protein
MREIHVNSSYFQSLFAELEFGQRHAGLRSRLWLGGNHKQSFRFCQAVDS